MKKDLHSGKTSLRFFLFAILFSMATASFAQPVISAVSATVVTKTSRVVIDGNNFGSAPTVTINGVTTNITINSRNNTQIKITINGTVSGTLRVTSASPATGFVDWGTPMSYITPVVKTTSSGVRVDRIFTDFNNFWTSGVSTDVTGPYSGTNSIKPNNRHNLLAFKYNGVIYSTGANDALLTSNGISFTSQEYRAYSSRGVDGLTNGALYLAMADLIDGSTAVVGTSPEIVGLGVFDVLIDGLNGLDLGTGVTNFNGNASISFFSDNAQDGGGTSFTDNVPEVLVTQVAQPGNTDYYHFTDVNGNIVGHPVQMDMNGIARVGAYQLDLFNFPNNANLATAVTNGNTSFGTNEERDIRLVGLRFSDFGIDASNFAQINSFDMLAGGTADIAFLAYNTASFQIASPVITAAPNSVRICTLPYNNNVTFSVGAGIQGGGPGVLNYQWKKNNIDILPTDTNYSGANTNTLTVYGPINTSKLATYKVEISNSYGAIVASSAVLRQGGTPVIWDGTTWSATPTNVSSLIFNGDYDSAVHLASGTKIEGCDCKVQNGKNVIIDSGDTMILQNALEVAPLIPAHYEPTYDGMGNYTGDVWVADNPAGTFTMRDDASLIQVSESAVNVGVISKKRRATNLHTYDYVYWSAPVSGFNISGIPTAGSPRYSWNPTTMNPNGTFGNWVGASGNMIPGKGYIVRVNSAADIEPTFTGTVNNGVYTYALTGNTNADATTNYWNLVGNPYPSAIKASEFISTNTDIEGNIRIWLHNAAIGNNNPGQSPYYNTFVHNYGDQYMTYNGTASVPAGFNGFIASGQGFFVQGKSTTGTVTFQNTFRYKETLPVYNNSTFYRMAEQADAVVDVLEPEISDADKSVIWLSLVKADNTSVNTAIGYVDGATNDKDRMYDASTEAGSFTIYSLIDTDPVIIQGRALPFDQNDTVQLGVAVPADGEYRIGIDQFSGLFVSDDQQIYLDDNFLGITHDLRSEPYLFTATTGVAEDRFVLRYATNALSNTDVDAAKTYAFVHNDMFQAKAAAGIQSVDIYDMTGKKVATYQAEGANTFNTGFDFASGFYMATLHLTDGSSAVRKLANR